MARRRGGVARLGENDLRQREVSKAWYKTGGGRQAGKETPARCMREVEKKQATAKARSVGRKRWQRHVFKRRTQTHVRRSVVASAVPHRLLRKLLVGRRCARCGQAGWFPAYASRFMPGSEGKRRCGEASEAMMMSLPRASVWRRGEHRQR